jgi:hypothetical protein
MCPIDAVFSTRPLARDLGEALRQWEEKTWGDLFIATKGVNWSPGNLRESVKWPGAFRSVIGPAAAGSMKSLTWLRLLRQPGAMRRCWKSGGSVGSYQCASFQRVRLALARRKAWLAGRWEDVARNESFEWKTKRSPRRLSHFRGLSPMVGESISLNVWAIRDAG